MDRNKGKLQWNLHGLISLRSIFHKSIKNLWCLLFCDTYNPQIFDPCVLICQITVQQIHPLSGFIRIQERPGTKGLKFWNQTGVIRMLMGNKNIQLPAVDAKRIDHTL